MLVRVQRKTINKSKQINSLKSKILFGTYRYIFLLVILKTLWYCYLYDTQWRSIQDECAEDDISNSHEGQINSEFLHTYGIAMINANTTSGELVKIVNTLHYGKIEKAYHINKTWVCVDENEKIIIYGATTNRKYNVYQYRVSTACHSGSAEL